MGHCFNSTHVQSGSGTRNYALCFHVTFTVFTECGFCTPSGGQVRRRRLQYSKRSGIETVKASSAQLYLSEQARQLFVMPIQGIFICGESFFSNSCVSLLFSYSPLWCLQPSQLKATLTQQPRRRKSACSTAPTAPVTTGSESACWLSWHVSSSSYWTPTSRRSAMPRRENSLF